ncbi:hypothetical protein Prudu_000364 [Prunus dulcis]|uniref:Uncharacterized protein n=1 Tax=Prunus dulcis TaxID=3755 RepID=A0A4Y1QL65_PRUDU|nr:hypothetical protein Prudu_000364 [Prunus dulcis]
MVPFPKPSRSFLIQLPNSSKDQPTNFPLSKEESYHLANRTILLYHSIRLWDLSTWFSPIKSRNWLAKGLNRAQTGGSAEAENMFGQDSSDSKCMGFTLMIDWNRLFILPTAATLRYVRESEEIRLAMRPLELIKRVKEIQQEVYAKPETVKEKDTKQKRCSLGRMA